MEHENLYEQPGAEIPANMEIKTATKMMVDTQDPDFLAGKTGATTDSLPADECIPLEVSAIQHIKAYELAGNPNELLIAIKLVIMKLQLAYDPEAFGHVSDCRPRNRAIASFGGAPPSAL